MGAISFNDNEASMHYIVLFAILSELFFLPRIYINKVLFYFLFILVITNEGVVVASVLNLKVYLSLLSHKQFALCIFFRSSYDHKNMTHMCLHIITYVM